MLKCTARDIRAKNLLHSRHLCPGEKTRLRQSLPTATRSSTAFDTIPYSRGPAPADYFSTAISPCCRLASLFTPPCRHGRGLGCHSIRLHTTGRRRRVQVERHNPRAFSVSKIGKTRKTQQRNLDRAQRKEVVPQVKLLLLLSRFFPVGARARGGLCFFAPRVLL